MFRSAPIRSFLTVASVCLLASCSETGISGPTEPANALAAPASSQARSAPSSAEFGVQDFIGHVTDAAHLKLQAIWWTNPHQKSVKVSQTINPSGGTIGIPETGLTLTFPAGAVDAPIKITVTSDARYVAYKMEPSGTTFHKDVLATQTLGTTSIGAAPLRTQLYAAYIADDKLSLSGIIKALEIEPSFTLFSPRSPRQPEVEVWVIKHFSRYILASG